MKSFIKAHQIKLFFVITLLIGWMPWYTGQGSIFFPAPIIAAFLVTFLADGIGGIKDIWLQLKRWRVNAKWYAFILLSPVVLYVVAILVHITLGGTSPEFPMLRTNQFMIPMTFIYFLLPWQSTAFLEEVGFRGYALGKLQTKYGPLFGTFILGLFFGAWLLPEFLNDSSFQYAMGGMSFYPWFIGIEIGWSLLMTYVYNKTGRSSLVSGYLFHTAFNAWPLILLTNAIPGQDLPDFDTRLFLISGIVVMLAGLLLTVITRGRLGYKDTTA